MLSAIRNLLSKRVVINGTYLVISNALQYVLAFVTGVLVARILGADAMGVFGLASAIGQIAGRIADCGMTAIVTRMVARDEPSWTARLAAAIAFRVWAGLISLVVIEVFAVSVGYALDVQLAVLLYALGQAVGGVRDTASAVYYGHQSIARPAIASAVFRIVSFVLTVAFLLAGLGILWTIAAMLVGQIVASAYLTAGPEDAARQIGLRFDRASTQALLRLSYPLAIAGAFNMVNMRADAMILSVDVAKAQLGFYSAAYAILIGLSIFPTSVLPALYPAISKRFRQDRRAAGRMFLRAQAVNLSVGLSIALVLTLTATLLVTLLYGGDFAPAGAALAVLVWALPCTYVSYTNSMYFNACDRQDLNLWTAVLAGTVNVAANLFLDPVYGIRGAAWATVISEATFLVATTILVSALLAEHRRA